MLIALPLLLTGCDEVTPIGEALSDFTLTDENPSSATYGTGVSVVDYRGQVSAWYFGHST